MQNSCKIALFATVSTSISRRSPTSFFRTTPLLKRLESSYDLKGIPLQWLRSYLSERTQMIISGNSRTSWVPIVLGVPQGSVLGPLLFLLFTADITKLISFQSARGHLFADDVQAYVQVPL